MEAYFWHSWQITVLHKVHGSVPHSCSARESKPRLSNTIKQISVLSIGCKITLVLKFCAENLKSYNLSNKNFWILEKQRNYLNIITFLNKKSQLINTQKFCEELILMSPFASSRLSILVFWNGNRSLVSLTNLEIFFILSFPQMLLLCKLRKAYVQYHLATLTVLFLHWWH